MKKTFTVTENFTYNGIPREDALYRTPGLDEYKEKLLADCDAFSEMILRKRAIRKYQEKYLTRPKTVELAEIQEEPVSVTELKPHPERPLLQKSERSVNIFKTASEQHSQTQHTFRGSALKYFMLTQRSNLLQARFQQERKTQNVFCGGGALAGSASCQGRQFHARTQLLKRPYPSSDQGSSSVASGVKRRTFVPERPSGGEQNNSRAISMFYQRANAAETHNSSQKLVPKTEDDDSGVTTDSASSEETLNTALDRLALSIDQSFKF